MKKTLVLFAVMMAFAVGIASAASEGVVNLSWDDCGTFGSVNKSFACNTNTGTNTMVASFISFVPIDSMNGNEVVIDYVTSAATMSPWWQIKTPGDGTPSCRNTALTAMFNFLSNTSCFDFWSGRDAQGGVGTNRSNQDPNRWRILVVVAVSTEQAGPLAANVETYSAKLVISNLKTVGTGACSGCTDGALFVPQSLRCTENGPLGPQSQHDMLTLGTYVTSYNGAGINGIPGATPTRNTTWGAVKSLYH